MFSFHKFLKDADMIETDWSHRKPSFHFPFISALYTKLRDYGLKADPILVDDGGTSRAYVRVGDRFYDFDSNISVDEIKGKYRPVPKTYLFNAASWKGLTESEFSGIESMAENTLNRALQFAMACERENPSNDTSILERRLLEAERAGFDISTVYFHETDKVNRLKIQAEGFDVGKVNARSNELVLPDGVFLKPNDEEIGVSKDPVQMPFFLKKGEVKKFESRFDVERELYDNSPEWTKIAEEKERVSLHFEDKHILIEEKITGSIGDKEAMAQLIKDESAIIKEWGTGVEEVCTRARVASLKYFRLKGYDSLHIVNDTGSRGRKVETTLIFDPNRILSTNFEMDSLSREKEVSLEAS